VLVPLVLAVLIAADRTDAAPSPSASPLKEIIRVHSTAFCTVFRENVFHAVQGLRVNDAVLVEGNRFLDAEARDAVLDPASSKHGAGFGSAGQLDKFRSGQAAHAVAENLTKVFQLLSDPDRFPANPQSDAERDLATMKKRLLAVAEAQQQSLNILEGAYESSSLDDLVSRGTGAGAALALPTPNTVELGDPLLHAGGPTPLPVTPAVSKTGSLYATKPIGEIATGLAISRHLTGSLEDLVAPAVAPGVNRCNTN
jgi:hypothetical protein